MADDFVPDSQFKPDPVSAPSPEASASPDFIPDQKFQSDEEKYGTTGQQVLTGVEGVAQGLAGPVATGAERLLSEAGVPGLSPEDQELRAKTNPVTHYGSEAAGLIAPALLTGGASAAARAGAEGVSLATKAAKLSQSHLIGQAGEAVSKALGLGAEKEIASSAAKAATEMALFQTGDEVSKMINNDPNQSLQTAVAHIGLSGLIGGAGGAMLGSVNPLWKAATGSKAAQLAEDFKGRIKEHLETPDPVQAVTDELSQYHKNITGLADEVYGPEGLKAQDIAKTVPELNEKIGAQVTDVATKTNDAIKKMVANQDAYPPRLTKKLQSDLDSYLGKVTNPDATSGDVFNAMQDLKQTLQGYAKFEKRIAPFSEEYDFVRDAKTLAHDIRTSLENPEVWGKAAERQQAINKAFTEYLPALKDFEKKFTSEMNGERVIDPGKINTYINQLGKPNAVLKREMLSNFIDASEKYKKVIGDTHFNLGIDNPIPTSSMQAIKGTLKEVTPGAKLADIFIKKGLTDVGGKAMGAAIGGGLGKLAGIPGVGALVGGAALGPFFSSVLPALAKTIFRSEASGDGLKAAIDYGVSVAQGEKAANKAIKSVFEPAEKGFTKVPSVPSAKEREKLNKLITEIAAKPDSLINVGGKVGHYLPDHNTAAAAVAGNVVQYLNSLRPNSDRKNPLDSKIPPSPVQTAKYNRALDIAQDPLLVVRSIQQGNLTSSDIVMLKTMYPDLYSSLASKLTQKVLDHVDKNGNIPYQQRLSLSMFLNRPLDSTMTPQAIVAAQPVPTAPQGPKPMPSPKKSTSALGKLPNGYQTRSQSLEAGHLGKK